MRAMGSTGQHALGATVALLLTASATFCAEPVPPPQSPDLFAALESDREHVYAGEVFRLTLSIYIQGRSLDKNLTIAGLPDPSQLQLQPFREMQAGQQALGGRTYDVIRYQCEAMAPTSGLIRLAPNLQGTAVRETTAYFWVQRERISVQVPVVPLPIDVRAIPSAGRPPDYSGCVGQFALQAQAEPRDVAAGDLISVHVRVAGDGNLDALPPLGLPALDGFKRYEPGLVREKSGPRDKLFRQIVVPLATNVTELPAIRFTFFDPRREQFRTAAAGPFPLRFHEPKQAQMEPPVVPPLEARHVQPELAPLKLDAAAWSQRGSDAVAMPRWLLALHAAPLVLLGLLYGWRRRRHTVAADATPVDADADVRAAEEALQAGDTRAALDRLRQSVLVTARQRWPLPPGSASDVSILSAARAAGAQPEFVDRLARLLQDVEHARYAGPAADATTVRRLVAEAGRLLSDIAGGAA